MMSREIPAVAIDATGPTTLAFEQRETGARPPSFAQERLWIIDRLVDDKALYNTCLRFGLHGELDVATLERALQEIVRRHEVLRTGFAAHDGALLVADAPALEIPLHDLRGETDPAAAALRHQQLAAGLPFDLQRPPLLRLALYRLAERRHELLLTAHHIIFDGASIDVLLQELGALYAAFAAGLRSPLADLALQSGDIAAQERARLTGEHRQRLVAFWTTQLGGELPVLALPTDRPRPPTQTFRGATLQRALAPGLVSAIEATCRRERVTPFMLVLGVYAIWLCRYAHQNDVIVGSPFALRGDARTHGLIGFFVNTLALRLAYDGRASFRQMLRHAREVCLAAYAHGELPFGDVVGLVQADRASAHAPVVQAMLAVQARRPAVAPTPALSLDYLGEVPADRARFDLSMVLDFLQDGAVVSLEYNRDLFDAASAARMLDNFLILLAGALDSPEQALDRLPLLSAAERERLQSWASAPGANVPDCGAHVLFARVAATQPDAIAVRCRDETLSFRALDERAGRLASHLAARGVAPGALVGICLPRTPEFLVAVLGVWKAGAAYVPLDPEQPAARHAFIVADAALRCVLTQTARRGGFDADQVVCLDDADTQRQIAAAPIHAAEHAADPHALAYAIYTSGSTGQPKGVLVAHRAVGRLLGDPLAMGYARDTVMLQSINVAFDASILETWGPLCCGGQLVLYPGQGLELPALRALIAQHGINTVTLPATLLDMWVEQLREATGLQRIVVGGEALSATTVARLHALDPDVLVINHYGPTENGILSSYYPIPRDFTAPIPIGLPVPCTALFVLNAAQELQPEGATGELYTAGRGVARGYLARPELTAEKFLAADAIAADSPAERRWYRTGDLVRWQPAADGGRAVLQFIGRLDDQVKIRGFRIELGEIEARLRGCDGVADAKAQVRRSAAGDRQIVAYVIPGDSAADDTGGNYRRARDAWRAALQAALPDYLVPAAFVCVPAWPLTTSGKVDLKALPAPDRDAYTQRPFAAPESATQAALLRSWQELLHIERISIDDNFFELGGHSLLATRLHNALRAGLDSSLPLRAIFDAPTIRRLAARIDAERAGTAAPSPRRAPPLAAEHASEAPLSYAQQRLWFVHRLDSSSAHYHIPYRLRLEGVLDTAALRRTLGDLLARHAVLRTTYHDTGSAPLQRCEPARAFDLPLHDLRSLPDSERAAAAARLLHAQAVQPFDLGRDAALRGCLVQLSAQEHWLALTVHHIAADGWAMDILEREFVALYTAHRHGGDAALPPLPLQYADYARWQRRWLDDAALHAQFAYWQAQLSGVPALHNLPLDRPRPALQTHRGALHRQTLPGALVARLTQQVQRHDATLFMGLYSVFALLLSRYSGETDIVVGTPVANRRDDALDALVGLFINTLVLRSDLSANPTFVELLAQSRAAALGAYEQQDLPFDMLVERINPARHPGYTPLFQILFALQNHAPAPLDLPDLTALPIPFDERFAKFDLALNLQPSGDGLLAEWEYNADLFDASTIEQLAASYAVLLDAVLRTPDCRARQLPLLDAAAQRRVLALGNDTDRDYAAADCLHTLIERQAARTPDAIAVIHADATLTYAQLNGAANRLARHLRRLGVGPDRTVAVAAERSPALVVGLLAVLKAGGSYVPLDSDHPEARLAAMLADCAPVAVLTLGATRSRVHAALAQTALPRTVAVDLHDDAGDWQHDAASDLCDADVGLDATHAAYVIYTSGSTGRPKGVLNEHRGIVNRLRWMQERYPLDAGDTFLQTAAIGFGASVVEIFWPLIAGARLVLTQGDGHKEPGYLAGLIGLHNVSIVHFVPSMLQAFLEHPRAGSCGTLERILCGGEPLPGSLARRCRERLPQAALTHLFGSSETAVLATGWDCTGAVLPDNLPIGTPGANTRIYLLDDDGRPVPQGVRGEIHIAGRQVARGYLHSPELTAQRFVADPFSTAPGARLYRSGDLGRQLADGSIEHLGRNDFQIKIRGQRVELGEIEAQLLNHSGVRQAVVLAREAQAGEHRLVAYLLADADAPPDDLLATLRAHLQAQLPSHMVPSAYVMLPQWPLNANGKLDRAALPEAEASVAAAARVAPENPLQQRLLAIWQELLKQPDTGIDCNFFDAGGHSLLALRLANRLREEYGYELELKTFFAAPTVRGLAQAVARHQQIRLAAQRFDDCDAAEIVEF